MADPVSNQPNIESRRPFARRIDNSHIPPSLLLPSVANKFGANRIAPATVSSPETVFLSPKFYVSMSEVVPPELIMEVEELVKSMVANTSQEIQHILARVIDYSNFYHDNLNQIDPTQDSTWQESVQKTIISLHAQSALVRCWDSVGFEPWRLTVEL